MIYSKGTLSISNASQVASGFGTKWKTRVSAGDILYVNGSVIPYTVAVVINDTELRLAKPFAEAATSSAAYQIISDFTKNYSLPYPRLYDVEKASVVKRSIHTVDTLLHRLGERAAVLEEGTQTFTADNVTITADSITATADGSLNGAIEVTLLVDTTTGDFLIESDSDTMLRGT